MTTYLAFPMQSFCIKLSLGLNVNKLIKVFPNGYKEFRAESNEDFFSKMLCNLKYKKEINKYSFYEVVNKNDEIVFCYGGEYEDCEALKKRFGMGVILNSNLSTINRKDYYANSVANMKSILKRLDMAPDFAEKFLMFDNITKENQNGYIPEKFKLIEPHVVEKISYKAVSPQELDVVHSYELDPMFSDMVSSTKEMLNAYNKLVVNLKNYEEIVHACDLRTLDILHDIEFNFKSMSASDGYKVAKKLYETRLYRRKAKDKIAVLSTFDNFFSRSDIERILNMDEDLKNRKYRKRVNHGIFDFEKAEAETTEEELKFKEELSEKIS